jgi:hypothetical protein
LSRHEPFARKKGTTVDINTESVIRLLEGAAAAITVVVGLVTTAHLLGWLDPETINEEGHSGEKNLPPELTNASPPPLDVRCPKAQDWVERNDDEEKNNDNDHKCQ